jgi:hypothetical protein
MWLLDVKSGEPSSIARLKKPVYLNEAYVMYSAIGESYQLSK